MGDRSGIEWQQVPEHNDIDTLVYRRLREIATLPSELCTDAEFSRRLHLDLTGLPPTVHELNVYLSDRSEGAFERAVDRLLASPQTSSRLASTCKRARSCRAGVR